MAEASPNQASLFIDKHLSRSLLDVSNSSGQVLAANPKPRVFEGHLDSKAVFVAALGKRIDISPCTQGGHFLVEIPKNLVVGTSNEWPSDRHFNFSSDGALCCTLRSIFRYSCNPLWITTGFCYSWIVTNLCLVILQSVPLTIFNLCAPLLLIFSSNKPTILVFCFLSPTCEPATRSVH